MSDPSTTPQQRDFLCTHCNGRIVIPYELASTSGPCPHCNGTIISPPPPELASPQDPAPAPAMAAPAVQQATQQAQPTQEIPQQVQPTQPIQDPNLAAAPQPEPEDSFQEDAKQEVKSAYPINIKKIIIPAAIGLFLLILIAGLIAFVVSKKSDDNKLSSNSDKNPENQAIRDANYIRIGWKKDALESLDKYIRATTVDGKIPYIANKKKALPRMQAFYGGADFINDSDTPANSFSVQTLSEEDRKRGIFMLAYDQPPQFSLKDFFRPLASLEVQYGIDQADLLLSTVARISNFALEPVRVHAFFKLEDGKMLLDWEIFAQTKYRKFRNFVELPDYGQTEVFRVLAVEDVPEKGEGVSGARTYRLADPANHRDSTRINVRIDSEAGRALSIINWRGSNNKRPLTRTATVELEWAGNKEQPELMIKRFICWEFLGLGGEEGPAPK